MKPPDAGKLAGHLIQNTFYRAPIMGAIFELFNQGLRVAVDTTILNRASDAMLEFDIFSGRDFCERFVSHFVSLDIVRKRVEEKLKVHYTGDKGQMIKEIKRFRWLGPVIKTEDVTDREKEFKRIKGDLVAMSEKWGNKFLKLVMQGTAAKIWNGMIGHYLQNKATSEEAQAAAIHLLSILTYCHPEVCNVLSDRSM